MIRTPPQHQSSPDKAPGQVVNHPVWPHKTSGQIVNDVTLADYIARKQRAANKMTFEEWYNLPNVQVAVMAIDGMSDLCHCLKQCWKAAQENM